MLSKAMVVVHADGIGLLSGVDELNSILVENQKFNTGSP